MVLGGLRRCEVLGLRLGDLRFAGRRVFIAEGKGGHQRLIPVPARFFTEVSAYLEAERPAGTATDAVFTVLKGPRRGAWRRSRPRPGMPRSNRPASTCT